MISTSFQRVLIFAVPTQRQAIERFDSSSSTTPEARLWYPPSDSETNNVIAIPSNEAAAAPNADADVFVDISGGGGVQPSATKGGSASATAGANTAAAVTTTISASGSNANGFNQDEDQALVNGQMTKSTSALVNGGLGFDIEYNDIGESEIHIIFLPLFFRACPSPHREI